jgi:predicted alpha-1,2-mannosidase
MAFRIAATLFVLWAFSCAGEGGAGESDGGKGGAGESDAGERDAGGRDAARTEPAPGGRLVDLVDPFIGTSGEGNTFPGAVVPWGMVSVSPHNALSTPLSYITGEPMAASGYVDGMSEMMGFGLTHLSGAGCPDLGAPVVAATSGEQPDGSPQYASEYRDQMASPGYYSVELSSFGIRVEATATARSGLLLFHPKGGAERINVLIDVFEGVSWGDGGGEITMLSETEAEGRADTGMFCASPNRQSIFFFARFDRPAASSGTWLPAAASGSPAAAGAWFSFDDPAGEPVELRVGISYVSSANARENLEAETRRKSFAEVRQEAEQTWEAELGRIRVEGGSQAQRTIFYTALYHALLHPNVISDVNGQHPIMGGAGTALAEGYTRYTVFSLWDTYRDLHPLLSLVYPGRQLDMARTLAAMTVESGRPPRWELGAQETDMMVGDPALPVIADTYIKGLGEFPVEDAYQVMRQAALDPPAEGSHRPGGRDYVELGYVPMELADRVWGPVSTTLEYAFADWSLARLAEALGETDDAEALDRQAVGYRRLFDEDTGLLRPKNLDGSLYEPFDPYALEGSRPYQRSGGPGYVEGTAFQYAFFAPHDLEGLADLHGGGEVFVERLQNVFDEGLYEMWNEPDIAYPYLFTFFPGEAWRAQEQARLALEQYYGAGTDGLPGNDDAGTLSAWYVLSALGLYPANPVGGDWRLSSPLFDRAEIRLDPEVYPGDLLVIEADPAGSGSPYVESVSFEGEALPGAAVSHQELVSGGVLRFVRSESRSTWL